ncbi:fibronectin type III domain-containing protein [Curtobacterium sp. SP.BCo]|uniref:fibronectin type III domain-containing protein n=1 Tax=Curtobacterium sp. SP.BCo TaxID=3435229 RepID=UPI003F733CEB
MYRAVLTVAAAAALVIGGVTPAVATPSSRLPGAPTSVQVSGAGDGAAVTWNAPRSGVTPTGYRVTVSPGTNQADRGVDRLPASARTDRFGWIRAGVTYSFTVRATTARGHGPEVRVRYTAPRTTTVAQSLYGLDASGAVVRFPTSGSGAARTVAASGAGYTADDVGDVFVPSSDGTKIRMYPARGGAPRVIATGLHLTADLRSDVAGNLYWVDSVSGAITKLGLKGTTTTVLPASGTKWTVGRDGTVTTYTPTSTGGSVVTATPGGAVQTREVATSYRNAIGYFTDVLSDGTGTLYVTYRAFGGSGYNGWWSLAPGSSTLEPVNTRLAYQYSATNNDSLVLGQSAEWCAAIAEQGPPNPCVADHTVTHLFSQDASGVQEDLPTSGVLARSNGLWLGAADTAGDLFVDAADGLWRIPAAGGAAQQVSTAQYSRLLVI